MRSPGTDRESAAVLAAYRALSVVDVVGSATVMLTPEAPGSPMLNRVLGLGVGEPATPSGVDRVLARIPPGTSFYVAVDPGASPPQLGGWLAARGLEPGWGWMLFRRGSEPGDPPAAAVELVRVATAGQLADAARIVRTGFGLPEAADAAMLRAAGSWELWLALIDGVPAGAGGLYVHDGVGYLGLAATLAEHRGRGAQTALLSQRIRRAAELGCDAVLTETGELRDDRPSASYRNLLRAGFAEVAVTAHWLGQAPER